MRRQLLYLCAAVIKVCRRKRSAEAGLQGQQKLILSGFKTVPLCWLLWKVLAYETMTC